MRHRPVNQSPNQPGADRDLVVMQNAGHSRSQPDPLRHSHRLSDPDLAYCLLPRQPTADLACADRVSRRHASHARIAAGSA
jgi:hypothetical protein